MSEYCANIRKFKDGKRGKLHRLPNNKNAISRWGVYEFCSEMCKAEFRKEKEEEGSDNQNCKNKGEIVQKKNTLHGKEMGAHNPQSPASSGNKSKNSPTKEDVLAREDALDREIVNKEKEQ